MRSKKFDIYRTATFISHIIYYIVYTERVVDPLPLMTYGLKLSLEASII